MLLKGGGGGVRADHMPIRRGANTRSVQGFPPGGALNLLVLTTDSC